MIIFLERGCPWPICLLQNLRHIQTLQCSLGSSCCPGGMSLILTCINASVTEAPFKPSSHWTWGQRPMRRYETDQELIPCHTWLSDRRCLTQVCSHTVRDIQLAFWLILCHSDHHRALTYLAWLCEPSNVELDFIPFVHQSAYLYLVQLWWPACCCYCQQHHQLQGQLSQLQIMILWHVPEPTQHQLNIPSV